MKKLLTLLVLTGTLFAQANNIFTLNPSVSSAGMGNVGIANAEVKNVFHNPAFAGLRESSSYRVSGGYGFGFNDWLVGARLNLYSHNFIDDYSIDMNYGFDIGAYKEFGNTSLGLVLKDVGGETEFLSQKLNLPMSVGVGVGHKFGNFTLASDVKFYEDYNSIGLGGQYDLGIASLKLGYYTESEFDVDYITLGGSIDAGIVDLSLAYYYNTDSFHNETLMISFGFDL